MKRYLIVGDGVAGARGAIKIKETDPKGEVHRLGQSVDVKRLKDSILKEGFDFKGLK